MAAADAEEETAYRPWSHLPADILQLISGKTLSVADLIRFRSVCPSWRSAGKPTLKPSPQIPRLLLPHDPKSDARSFLGLLSGEISTFSFPETQNKIVCGSAFGWLALVDSSDSSLSLWNPLTRAQIPLPSLSSNPFYQGPDVPRYRRFDHDDDNGGFDETNAVVDESDTWKAFARVWKGYPWKVSLSASPSSERCVVCVTLSIAAEFALCRIGSDSWSVGTSSLPWPLVFFTLHGPMLCCFDDFMGCRAIHLLAGKMTHIRSPADRSSTDRFHVVRSEDDLLMVVCYAPDEKSHDETERPPPRRVRVFRLEAEEEDEEGNEVAKKYEWVDVETMGDHAIFLSPNHSSVVRAQDFPGCREDSIYFSDVRRSDHENTQPGIHYMDVYDMKEDKYELLSCNWTSPVEGLRNATWFAPSFF